jgi:plastocyanin
MKMGKPIVAALSALALSGIAGVLATDAFAGAAKTVKVGDNYFVRQGGATVSVRRGTTVTWRWTGSAPHNITVRRGPARFHSRTQTRGSYSRRLIKPGLYSIYCTVHGPAMSMRIRVR